MIRATIFDMDGLLIDSEPLWGQAEIAGFGAVGLVLDPKQCRQTVGLGIDEVVELRFRQRRWSGRSPAEVAADIQRRVVALIRERGKPMPGAVEAIAFARTQGAKIGLATTSDPEVVIATLDTLDLHAAFDHVQSAAGLAYNKPHPEVYLACARRLNVDPRQCIALEDSVAGLIAAKAARMKVVAVPESDLQGDPRFSLADVVLSSLRDFSGDVWRQLDQDNP